MSKKRHRGPKSWGRKAKRRKTKQGLFGQKSLHFETLEERRLLAVLTNGPGDGTVSVTVDGYGAYGSSLGSFGSNANYDPVGPIGAAGTTYLSGVSLRTNGNQQWLATGFNSGKPDVATEGSDSIVVSSFAAAGLDFELEQRLTELFVGVGDGEAERSGSLLTQTYRITNTTANTIMFDLSRYVDGDLRFNGTISDGGGRFPFGGSEILFETDSATGSADEATFVGITAEGGVAPETNRYEISSWNGLRSNVQAGNLRNLIIGDGADEDQFVDAGARYDLALALRNEFVLSADESVAYVTRTIFGTGNPDALAQVSSLELAPITDEVPVTATHSVTATALDDNGEPVVGAAIQFEVTGANATSGLAFTNFEGQATFSYSGANAGTDTIAATAGLIASEVVTVEWTPIPNLVVSDPTAPVIARRGSQIQVGWTVTNADDATAVAPWSDSIYLSTDQTLDEFDVLIDSRIDRTEDLESSQQYSRSRVVTIPNSVAVGDYFLLIATDVGDQVFERSEADNVVATPIEVALPDLVIDAPPNVTPTGSPTFGESVDVSWTVRNTGSVPAELSTVDRIWLSTDATLDGGDTLLASVPTTGNLPLDPDAVYSASSTVDLLLSQNLTPGDYYVIVEADGSNTEPETDNSNNWQTSALISIDGPPLPDLFVSSITAPIAAVSNGAIPVSWEITNQGDAAVSGVFRDRVFLSSDQVIGNDTVYGTFEFVGTIGPGQTITRTQNITLPVVFEGDFYVVVTTDFSNEVFEQYGAEGNNSAIDDQAIVVTLAPFPNLQVAEVIAPPTGASSQEVVVEWIVTNVGTGATNTPRWSDRVYLSTDQTFDGADVLLGTVANPAFLPVGDSYQSSLTATLPRGIDGDYYFIVRTDIFNQVFELDGETDNQGVGGPTVVELTPPPDLQVTSVQGPANAFSGQPISINWSVANNGMGPTRSSSWTDRVFLSLDNVLDGGDTLIASAGRSGALDVGENYSASASGTLPIGISGDYFFLVQTDAFDNVFEHVFEANNTGFDATPTDVRLTPPPDLEVVSVNAPTMATASRQIIVDYRVGNLGATVTPNSSWNDRVFLSTDNQFDASDVLLQSRTRFGALEAGQSYDASFNATLADDLVGEFFVIVVTDFGNTVFEGVAGETNNTGVAAETVTVESRPADLTVMSFVGPSTAEAGQSLLLDWTILNSGIGDTAVASWQDRVVLSSDETVSPDDITLVAATYTGLLGPGNQYDVANQLATIPFTIAPGNYFLLLTTDANGQVFEGLSETNNSAAQPISISRETSDLQVTSVSAAANASSGGLLNVTWTVENSSPVTTNANFWFDEVFLSADNQVDAADLLLGTVQRSNRLAPSDQYLVSRDFTLPKDLSGQFFIIVRTDATDLVVEGPLENNNDRATAGSGPGGNDGGIDVELSPATDLIVTAVDAPNDAFSGQPLELSWTVENVGPGAAAGTWFDSVFLSLDQVFDRSTDLYLGFANRPSELASGASYSQTTSFDLPAGLSGPYWAFVVTDGNNRIAERDAEANNSAFDPLPVQVALTPPADFVVGTITVPATGVSGQQATIAYTVDNLGSNPAVGTWTDSIYLSADNQWDINDPLFGRVTSTNANVPGGGSYSQSLSAPLPGVVPGDYSVIIRSDILNQIRESDDGNNIGVSLDQAAVDFEELQLGVASMGTLGEGQAVYYKVVVPAGETLSFLLDSLAVAGSNEVYVAFERVPSRSDFDFSSTEPFEVDQRALVPSTDAGTYFVLVRAITSIDEPRQFSLSAELLEFGVFDSNFGRGGNSGNLTIQLNGARFSQDIEVTLSDSEGLRIGVASVWYVNPVRAYATFDLRGLPLGIYDVAVSSPNGSQVSVPDSLEVVPGVADQILASLDGPSAVRPNRTNRMVLSYANAGINDLPAPLLLVRSTSNTPVGTTASSLEPHLLQIFASTEDGPHTF